MKLRKNTHLKAPWVLVGTLFLILLGNARYVQAQCTSCSSTITVSGTTNTNLSDPGNNSTVCITGSGTYTGTINVNNRNSVNICVGTGVTFSGTVQNWHNNFTINNYGTWTTAFGTNSDVTFNNSGTTSISGGWTINGAKINSTGTFTTTGGITFNTTNSTFSGPTSFGDVTVNSGSSVSTANVTINGSLTGNGNFSASGTATISGSVTVNSSSTVSLGNNSSVGGSFTNNGNFTGGNNLAIGGSLQVNSGTSTTFASGTSVGGSFVNNATVRIDGSFAVSGAITNNGSGTITTTNSAGSCNAFYFGSSFTNWGSVTGGGSGRQLTLSGSPTSGNAPGANTQVSTPPVSQPGSLTFSNPSPNVFNGSFAAASPAPGGYAVIRRRGANISTSNYPQFGTSITVGSYVKGCKVIALLSSSTTTFSDSPDSCGTYYYAVISMSNASGSCAAFATGATSASTTATGGPNVSTIAYSSTTYCQAQTLTNVTRTGATGGSYSVSPTGLAFNSTTGAINPSASSTGTYTVSYTVPAGNGCLAATSTASVQVTTTPTATISYASTSYCRSASAISVTQSGVSGGSYSSSSGLTLNTTNGQITPSSSTAGSYTVSYNVPSSASCPARSYTTSVSITTTPVNTISYAATSFCKAASAQTVTLSGTPGGSYSSTTGLSITSAGLITPSSSATGTYTVTYTAPTSTTCPQANSTTSVSITNTPSATISYSNATYCHAFLGATAPTLTGTTGGSYSASTSLSLNSVSGLVIPSASTAGSYTITYTIAGTARCPAQTTTTPMTIAATPSATISYSSPTLCTSASAISVSQSGTTGGTYSVSPTGLTLNSSSGQITPSSSSTGSYTITYTMAATAGCPAQTTTTSVSVTAPPTNSIAYDRSVYCSASPSGTITLTGGSGGTYSSSPGGLSMNGSSGNITPSSSSPGTYVVTYTAPANAACPIANATASVTITSSTAPFVWSGGASASMASPGNWTPSRGSVNTCDVLQISTGGSVTLTSASTQTIRKIIVTNNTNLTLSASGTATINLTGDNGVALQVDEGSSLTLNGSQLTVAAQAGTQVTLNGQLILTAGTLNISGATLLLASTSSSYTPFGTVGTGRITTSTGTDIILGTSGKTSMANFTLPNGLFSSSPAQLNNLILQTAGNTISLGNQDISLYGTFSRPSGSSVLRLNGRTLNLYGSTSGTPTVEDNTSSSTLGFYGSGDLSNLRFNGSSPYLRNLILNRTYSTAIPFPASGDLTIGGSVSFTKGIVNTGSNKIILATSASLGTETDSSHIRGTLQQTRTLTTGATSTFSNMRLSITAYGSAPGVTTVTRVNDAPIFLGMGNSVRMHWIIDPAVDVNLNATLVARLLPSELNNKAAADLEFCRLPQNSSWWEEQPLTQINTSTLTYTLDNIPAFSTWSLGIPGEILPVRLTSFSGKPNGSGRVDLSWVTVDEEDNAGFALYRMKDGGTFDSIGFVKPLPPTDGSRRYTFIDNNAGINNVYRLRQFDLSGKAETFPLLHVTASTGLQPRTREALFLYPNPVSGNQISVVYQGEAAQACHLIVRTREGATVYTGSVKLDPGLAHPIDLPHLAPGFYILEVQDADARRHYLRLVKE